MKMVSKSISVSFYRAEADVENRETAPVMLCFGIQTPFMISPGHITLYHWRRGSQQPGDTNLHAHM